jgi:hypothetical protein
MHPTTINDYDYDYRKHSIAVNLDLWGSPIPAAITYIDLWGSPVPAVTGGGSGFFTYL